MGQGSPPFFQRVDELVVRLGERLDALTLQLEGHGVELDPDGLQLAQRLPGSVERLRRIDRSRDATVVFEGFERGWGQRIDRVGPDQLFNVADVAVARVLRARAGPQRSLDRRARLLGRSAPKDLPVAPRTASR